MDLIKSGSYIDPFYAKACATTTISTVAGYQVVLATLLFYYAIHVSRTMRKCVMSYANNKGADQPAHPRSLISAFVIRCLDSIISLDSIAEISRL